MAITLSTTRRTRASLWSAESAVARTMMERAAWAETCSRSTASRGLPVLQGPRAAFTDCCRGQESRRQHNDEAGSLG